MNNESTTQLSVIVTLNDQPQQPGGIVHKTVMDHFASPRFKEYAAYRHMNQELLKDISTELTRFLRNDNIRQQCGFSDVIAAICTDGKGYTIESKPDSNIILFTIQLRDGE